MNKIYLTNTFYRFSVLILMLPLIISGCKKNDSSYFNLPSPLDLTTQVKSSVSGFVTDENDQAVYLATVQVGSISVTTDKYGHFEVKNVDVVKDAATVTVTRTGYFKGIKTYLAEAGKSAFFRIKLIPKKIIGTVDASAGGTIYSIYGLGITLPANAVVNAASNIVYSGTVNIAAYWIDPTSAELTNIMPGDLRGINAAGNMQLLTTFGMAAVELTGAGGELLQIAPDKKAILNFPIPVSILSSAPANIPLWYFDEAKGLWQEEGIATKYGNSYIGEVRHFSFWNCDAPGSYVQFNCTLVDQNNHPLPFAFVRISMVSNPLNRATGYTDTAGYVAGLVPDNTQLKMEVFSDASCTATPLYSQVFTTTNTNISLGTIIVNNPAVILNINGTATNCSNASLSQGVAVIKYGYRFYTYPVTNGLYNINFPVCSTPANVSISIVDMSNQQSSLPTSYTLNAGNNTIPDIQACGTSAEEYMYYTIDGTPSYLATGSYYFLHYISTPPTPPFQTDWFLADVTPTQIVYPATLVIERPFSLPVISAPLVSFNPRFGGGGPPFPNPITVYYTEYGNIGQYIAGNFSGTIKNTINNAIRNVSCSFRVKRRY